MPAGTRTNLVVFTLTRRYFRIRNYPSIIILAKGVMRGIVLLSPGTMMISL